MRRSNHLLRVLGIVFAFAAVIGSVIGQGILRAPGVVAEASSSPAIIIGLWIVGAIIALLTALAFAELGAALPKAGGMYAFVTRAFGERTGAVVGIAVLIVMISSVAILAFVIGEFLVRLGVGGGKFGPGALGMMTLVLFFLMNLFGTKVSGITQIALSALKCLVLFALVAAFFVQPGAVAVAEPAVVRTGWLPFGVAILVIIGTYNGYADLVFYGEEIKNPGRSIPRALFGGIIGIAAIYLLVNLAMLHMLTPDQMAGSEFAAADAAGQIFGPNGDLIITGFGIVSIGAITNLSLMSTSRGVFAVARAGVLPKSLAYVSKRGVPISAMAVVSLTAAAFLVSGSYLTLSSTSIALNQFLMAMAIGTLFMLRRKEPELKRPYLVPLYPWSIILALLINVALFVVFFLQDPYYSILGFVIVAVLSGIYFLISTFRGANTETADAQEP